MKRTEQIDQSIKVVASVAIVRNLKILLINEQKEPYNGMWVLPQGYVKPGETVSDAARREIYEELGVEVDLDGLVGVYDDFIQEGALRVHYVIVAFMGTIKGPEEPRPTSEAIDSAWVDTSRGLPSVPPVIRRVLHDVALAAGRRGQMRW